MEYDNKLQEIIKKKIDELNRIYITSKEKKDKLILIDSIIDDISNLSKFNINDYEISEKNKSIITFLMAGLTMKKEISENDRKILNNILMDIKNKIDISKLNDLKNKIDTYEKLLDRIKLNNINVDDVDILLDILKNTDNINLSVQIMKHLVLKARDNIIVNPNNTEEIEELKITNIDKNDLTNLLKKYNIDFNQFKPYMQNELLTYGDLNNIDKIIFKFQQYGLNLSQYVSTFPYQIVRILIYSNERIVENILNTYKNNNLDLNECSSKLFQTPSKFVNRKKSWIFKDRDKNPISNKPNDENEIGSYEDFIKNFELFKELADKYDMNIKAMYFKGASYFEKPHHHILTGIKNFELYSIDPKYYLKTLSSFAGHKQLDSFDMFIEFNLLNYVLNNMSRSCLLPNSLIFYKLKYAKQQGIDLNSLLFRGCRFPSLISYDNNEYNGLNKNNYTAITETYQKEKNSLTDCYDEVINKDNNNELAITFVSSKYLKKLDELYLVSDSNGYPDMRVYLIDGIRISRLKFIRYMNTLIKNGFIENENMIMYCLTKNSILTEEEYLKIKNKISELFYEKVI